MKDSQGLEAKIQGERIWITQHIDTKPNYALVGLERDAINLRTVDLQEASKKAAGLINTKALALRSCANSFLKQCDLPPLGSPLRIESQQSFIESQQSFDEGDTKLACGEPYKVRDLNGQKFTDLSSVDFTLQESSLATEPAIWFGSSEIAARMHLSQRQMAALIPVLKHFVSTGEVDFALVDAVHTEEGE